MGCPSALFNDRTRGYARCARINAPACSASAEGHLAAQTAGMAKNKRKRKPKTVLKLPDLEQSKSAVLNSTHLSEFAAILRSRDPRIYRLVLLGTSPRFQQNRRHSIPHQPRRVGRATNSRPSATDDCLCATSRASSGLASRTAATRPPNRSAKCMRSCSWNSSYRPISMCALNSSTLKGGPQA
jgi:hypothetical protein